MGSVPVALGKSYLAAALYSCSVVSIIYFFSSIFKKALVSAFIGLFLLFLVLPGLQMLMNTMEIEKWFLLTSHSNLITAVLNESRVYPEGFGGSNFHASFGTGIAVMIAYAIIFFAAGTWIANRKDMT
jgi:ABC-type transport system involved in multi-copper enzyme maturation permease subunit